MGTCMPYGDCGGGCPACESCVSCWCQCTSECCQDSDCDPSQHCENCQCACDTCWTTGTESGSIEPCPPCSGGSCSGTTEERNNYEVCKQAVTGQSGYCECYMTEQVVGYTYPCKRNWAILKMVECSIMTGFCILVCVESQEPELCADCFMEMEVECCDFSPCEICDLIEACEKDESNPDNVIEIKEQAFSHFDGGSCSV